MQSIYGLLSYLINVVDLSLLASNYNCNVESLDWNTDYDLNGDKIIDLYDLVIIAKVIENEDGVEEDEFEPIVYVAKSIVTMKESLDAKHGPGGNKIYLLGIENLGFQEEYQESIRLKNKTYKNDKYRAYANELYFICDSINNSMTSYKETNDQKYLKELESNLDKCKTFFVEMGEGYSDDIKRKIKQISDIENLKKLLKAAARVESLEEFKKLI